MNAGPFDTLTELPPDERPVRIEPPVPDLETGDYFYGPAGAEVRRLRERCASLAAENALLLAALRERPSTRPCACTSPDRTAWLGLPYCRRCGCVLRAPYGSA
jgi:hypothetical protein